MQITSHQSVKDRSADSKNETILKVKRLPARGSPAAKVFSQFSSEIPTGTVA